MNWLDIAILAAMAVTTLVGLRMGIIKAVLTLAGLVVGIILAGRFYTPLSQQLSFIPEASMAKIAAFAIILIGVALIAALLAQLLKWAASMMMLGWANHLGGAIFGLVLGALLCSALLAMVVKFLGMGETVAESTVAPLLLDRLPLVLALLPDEFDAVRSFFQ